MVKFKISHKKQHAAKKNPDNCIQNNLIRTFKTFMTKFINIFYA